MSHPRLRTAVAAVVLLAAREAAADPPPAPDAPLHLRSSSSIVTEGGSHLDVPPGYYLTEPQWDALDFEIRALQDERTRLRAENTSLRESAGTGAPWWAIGAAVVLGAAAGAYAWDRWAD